VATFGGGSIRIGDANSSYENGRIWSPTPGYYLVNVSGSSYDTSINFSVWNAALAKYVTGIRSLKPLAISSGEECVWLAGNVMPTGTSYDGTNYIMRLLQNGDLDVKGTINPRASTTTAATAPIKLPTGVLMTTPEAGAIEYDGTNLYFTDSGGTRRQLAVV
jgi:hypothetical protein